MDKFLLVIFYLLAALQLIDF